MPGRFVIGRDARGSLVHVRRRDGGACVGCIEVGLYEIVRALIGEWSGDGSRTLEEENRDPSPSPDLTPCGATNVCRRCYDARGSRPAQGEEAAMTERQRKLRRSPLPSPDSDRNGAWNLTRKRE